MLRNIANPSAEIREGYSGHIVATTDGRTLTGVVVEQDKNVVVLLGSDGKELTLSRSAIEEIKPAGTSIMPEGLLKGLGDQQVRDLFRLPEDDSTFDRLILPDPSRRWRPVVKQVTIQEG